MNEPKNPISNKRVIINCTLWDEGDYIISIRPDVVEPWLDKPVGHTVNKAEGEIIKRWLQQNWIPLRDTLNLAVKQIHVSDSRDVKDEQ